MSKFKRYDLVVPNKRADWEYVYTNTNMKIGIIIGVYDNNEISVIVLDHLKPKYNFGCWSVSDDYFDLVQKNEDNQQFFDFAESISKFDEDIQALRYDTCRSYHKKLDSNISYGCFQIKFYETFDDFFSDLNNNRPAESRFYKGIKQGD